MSQHGFTAGFESFRKATPRDPMFSHEGERILPAGITINSTLAIDGKNTGRTFEIRAGSLMGRITATGLYVGCKRTKVNDSSTGTQTEVTVDDAIFFKAGDVISIGSDTGLVIDSVNYLTDTITLTAGVTFADDEDVVAEDGSQTCLGILKDTVELLDSDRTGSANKESGLYVGGLAKESLILGDLVNILLDTNAKLEDFQFSDTYGQ